MTHEESIKTREAQALVWHGALMVLLGLVSGFTTLFAKAPSAALSAHNIGVIQGALLFGVAGAWHLIPGTRRQLQVVKYTLLIGTYANWVGSQFAAFWSAGRSLFTVTGSGMPEGSALWQDAIVAVLLNTSILVIVTCVLLLWLIHRGCTTLTETRDRAE